MDFQQADEQFKQLKARYAAGELTEAQFKAQLQDLMVQDAQGAWWMIGYETEHWYRHDGTNWVQTDPPGTVVPAKERVGLPPAAERGTGGVPIPSHEEEDREREKEQAELTRLYNEAQGMLDREDWRGAIRTLELLLAKFPDQEKARRLLAEARVRLQQRQEDLELQARREELRRVQMPAPQVTSGPAAATAAPRPRRNWLLPVGIVVVLCLLAGAALIFPALLRGLLGAPATPYPYATEAPTEAPATEAPATNTPSPADPATDTPSPAATEPPASNVLYSDDFSDPNSGFGTYSDNNASADYIDGFYVIRTVNANVDIVQVPPGNFSDMRVEVDTYNTGGQDVNHYGIICRYQDINNFYYLLVSSDGHFMIGKRLQSNYDSLTSSFSSTFSGAILSEKALNRLRADCIGNTLTLYANDQMLVSTIDSSLNFGSAGVMAGSEAEPNVEIYFDNFVVYQP